MQTELVEKLKPHGEEEERAKPRETCRNHERAAFFREDGARPSFARTKAGRLKGRKTSMTAAPTPTISMPSPIGSAWLQRKIARKAINPSGVATNRSMVRRNLRSPRLHIGTADLILPSQFFCAAVDVTRYDLSSAPNKV